MKMKNLENEIEKEESKQGKFAKARDYLAGCINSDNSKLYGTFQERAALNITQFPKIQGSLLIRMGLVYPIASALIEQIGIPTDAQADIMGVGINYHTWAAGYLAYLAEIQTGMSKYPMELASKGVSKIKDYLSRD